MHPPEPLPAAVSNTETSAQRARGEAYLDVVFRENGPRGPASQLADLRMSGSLKLLFPRHVGPLDAVFLNSAGGVTGGDAFSLSASVRESAALRLTSQAAERIYRAVPGQIGRVSSRCTLEPNASLNWLPQETILFDGAALDRSLSIDMAASSKLLACEALIFGRTAMGERVNALHLRDRIDLRVDGKLIFADRLKLDGDAHQKLQHMVVTNGALAVASVILAAPGAIGKLDAVRHLLPQTCGASALSDNLVFMRFCAESGYALRQTLIPVLHLLSGADLPRPWMI